MDSNLNLYQTTRRNFLKTTTITCSALFFFPYRLFSSNRQTKKNDPDFEYKYRTVSVEHVKELGAWIEKLNKDGKLSNNETYRKYIGAFNFDQEKVMPGAKSIIILSIPQNIISVTFHKNGHAYEIKTPTGYFDDGITDQAVMERLKKEVLKDTSVKLKGGIKLPLKTLAVRSGLAEYGKNNITFVDGGYGSFHRLAGFYTDAVLQDSWRPLKLMQLCKGCSICMKACPTKCITEENFVIDVGKCVTLYNELQDPMPSWIDPKAHNALAGCLKCQDTCPANIDAIKRVEKLDDITEEETDLILNQGTDKAIQESIVRKLNRLIPSTDDIHYLTRNLKLVLPNTPPEKS